MKKSSFKILLIGNPNCGKTTIFNSLCSMNAKVGNYSGVTVAGKSGEFVSPSGIIRIEDLPGVYTLSASTAEERIARDAISGGDFDFILNIVDASNFERNLFLTIQLAEMKLPMAIVLNMTDELEKNGKYIDVNGLSAALGVPVTTCVGYDKKSINSLKGFIEQNLGASTLAHFPWENLPDNILSEKIKTLSKILRNALPDDMQQWTDWLAVRALENDEIVLDTICEKTPHISTLVGKIRTDFENETGELPETLVVAARYGLIDKLCMPFLKTRESRRADFTRFLDSVFLNKYFGIPIFFALMFFVFEFVFALGDPLMAVMESFFSWLGGSLSAAWEGESLLKDFVVNGAIGGVGGVFVFLPNILLLFFALSILEDSGYMARAAFLCDRFMKRFGLSGSSVIPMLIGFGCSVPAIIGARTLKSKMERFATIMVIPLFSCGARFPVYVLLIPAFFAQKYSALVMFGLYLTGIIAAMIFARVLRSTFLRGGSSAFLIELPPYRLPRLNNIWIQVKSRAGEFVKKAGTVIFVMSLILWSLSTFPRSEKLEIERADAISAAEKNVSLSASEKSEKILSINAEYTKEKFDITFMGRLGETLEPVFKPLGFDNKIVSALLASLAAKEVFITQMGIIYGFSDDTNEDSPALRDKISADYSPIQGVSILLFILLTAPCIATIGTTYTETKSAFFAASQFFGLAAIAYCASLLFYQIALHI